MLVKDSLESVPSSNQMLYLSSSLTLSLSLSPRVPFKPTLLECNRMRPLYPQAPAGTSMEVASGCMEWWLRTNRTAVQIQRGKYKNVQEKVVG